MTILSGKPLRQVVAPALPQPPRDGITAQWQDQFNNVLRLYFQQLGNVQNSLIASESGGASLFMPHGTFRSVVTQTLAIADTKYYVAFEVAPTQGEVLGISINGGGNDTLTVDYAGVYQINLNLQVRSTNASVKNVYVWLEVNGVDVPNSARRTTYNDVGGRPLVYTVNIELAATDELKIAWAADDTNATLNYVAPSAPYPAIPSAVLSVTHESNVLLD